MIKPDSAFWEKFKSTNGALSASEAVAIVNISALAPCEGWAFELGTFRAKSSMAAMLGLKTKFFMLVDPIFEDKRIIDEVDENIKGVNTKISLKYSPLYSTDILPSLAPYAYVFVDSGSHQDGLPMQEVKLLEDNMLQGGIIAFHDFQSQFVEVEEAYNYLIGTGKYDKIDINWNEIIEYVNANDLEANNNSWHHTELKNPCFVGAVRRK